MAGMTLTEKILARHAGRERVTPGEVIWVEADLLLTHDICGPGVIAVLQQEIGPGARVWDPDRVVIIPDHYIFTADPDAHRNLEVLRTFVKEQGIRHFYDAGTERYRGVCHVALAEEGFTRPGELLFGTDSHTCTAGAFGMFATGIGNTDAAFVAHTGKLWLRVPETLRMVLEGVMPKGLTAKDVILALIGALGVDGATYRALELVGSAVEAMDMPERMTLCNMAIECGAKSGIVAADETTRRYLEPRSERPWDPAAALRSDPDAPVFGEHHLDVTKLTPQVARPHRPDNVVPAETLAEVTLDRCYIGSCTGGKLEDFRRAAEILDGQRVAVDTVCVPATTTVATALDTERRGGRTLREILEQAGARFGLPSCAACLGGPADTIGRLAGAEVCLSTTNRNFPGRMGSPASAVYLASPYTVAASAITGRITDPRQFL